MGRVAHALLALSALAACKSDRKSAPPPAPASSPAPASALASAPAPAPTREPAATAAPPRPPIDAGPSACRLLYGPAQQPFKGAAALHASKDGIDVVFNEDGTPRLAHVASGPVDPNAKPVATRAAPTTNATSPPCTFAGSFVYCVAKGGDVVRSPIAGGPGKTVGAARAGTRVDATTIAGDHTVVAYLASRKTTEGWTSEAWAAVDDQPAERISEPGSGATSVDLAPRGATVVTMMLDARAALTPVHARVLSYASKLEVGADAVIFVGGPPERHTASSVATPNGAGPAFALIPIAKDVSEFGMAAVRVDDPPQVDAPVVWSPYPNGLDPAPLAATQGHSPMRVARVRPLAPEPSSPKVLEIGRLEPTGAFVAQGIVPTSGTPTDLAVEIDAQGALWIAYSDGDGAWLERRQCP